MKKRIGLSLILLVLASGCVKDRDYEDWRRERLNEELGELEQAAGTYRGILVSKDSQEPLGAMEVILTPEIKVIPGVSGQRADGQPILSARITFEDSISRFAVTALDSYFDAPTGKLQMTLSLNRSSGRTEQVILSGSIGTETLVGRLEITGASELAAAFQLNRTSKESLSDIALKVENKKPGELRNGQTQWIGSTEFRSKEVRPVSAVFIEPKLSPEEQFLNRFAPIQIFQFTLNYGDSLKLIHEGALWDRRTGKLTGRAKLSRDGLSSEVVTECQSSDSQWLCTHQTQGSGEVATTTVTLKSENYQPIDPSDPRSVLTLNREGSAVLEGGEVSVQLKAVYAARSREQELWDLFVPSSEKILTLSLQFGLAGQPEEKRLVLVFENSALDLRSHTLDGRTQIRQGSSIFDVTLRCDRFIFPELEGSSSRSLPATRCIYFSSHRSKPLTILFPESEVTQQ